MSAGEDGARATGLPPVQGDLEATARELGEALRAAGDSLVTAESCTGGWMAQCSTAIAGSSAWFDRGFVAYSNAAKIEQLGVSAATLETHGAVSEPVVLEMAAGGLARSRASVCVAASGVSGPGGGTPAKPVGTVCVAWARRGGAVQVCTARLEGDRTGVRARTVQLALAGLAERLGRGF